MKKLALLLLISITSLSLYSQTYKLETVYEYYERTYLSHWNVLEGTEDTASDTFSLWGYHQYSDSVRRIYEVEYFKGSAKETFSFLNNIQDFYLKYQNEDKVITYISGVQVKTIKAIPYKDVAIYDKERKVFHQFRKRDLSNILDKFVKYCDLHNIDYTNK